MTTTFIPISETELRADRKQSARLVRQRKMLTLMDAGTAQASDNLELERSPRDLVEFVLRWLDGLTQAVALVEKRGRTGSLTVAERDRLTLIGDRLVRSHNIFESLAAVEAEIDAMPRGQLETFRPETSTNWSE